MSGVTRATQDTAVGIILGGISNVLVNGKPIAVMGDLVTAHDAAPHDVATMIAGSNQVFAGGKLVVKAGDLATCAHPATGSTNVITG
jgi:uncharacterized Zn-binding protein involved in type VI secretion